MFCYLYGISLLKLIFAKTLGIYNLIKRKHKVCLYPITFLSEKPYYYDLFYHMLSINVIITHKIDIQLVV